MIINLGSHRPQGPWDPDEKRRWIDTTYSWTLLPILLLVGIVIAVSVVLGG